MFKSLFKQIFFFIHLTSIFLTNIFWIYYPGILIIHCLVLLSWQIWDNKCILTIIEYKLFNETIMSNNPKFNVPKFARIILILELLIGIWCNIIY